MGCTVCGRPRWHDEGPICNLCRHAEADGLSVRYWLSAVGCSITRHLFRVLA
jgi:hypothetical protein